MSENNPYSTPSADLHVPLSDNSIEAIKKIPRFSTWAVVGLSIITLGIYSYYWLYSRTKMLNSLLVDSNNKIPSGLTLSIIILAIINFFLSLYPLFNAGQVSSAIDGLSMFISIIGVILFLVWAFSFRKRLNTLSNSQKGERFWLGGILTFLINVYYFQYKINQIHDEA
jgi:uncharacterized Tic20 family protein